MRYKNEDANRYRVNFMIATEKLMDKLTVREFISYLEEKAEFEDTTHEYIDGKVVECKAYDLKEENSNLHKEFLVTSDGRVFYWRTLMDKIELIDEEESKPAPEQRARNLIGSLATSQLLDQWEMTTTMTDPNTSTLRGWFMDELEKRFPDQFDKWLDSDCRDEDLRKLEPNGTFHEVEWGEHQDWANKYVEENYPDQSEDIFDAGGWLTDRGWVLLHNPSQGIAFATGSLVRDMTKAQKEFLYDYYTERDCKKEANEVWKE